MHHSMQMQSPFFLEQLPRLGPGMLIFTAVSWCLSIIRSGNITTVVPLLIYGSNCYLSRFLHWVLVVYIQTFYECASITTLSELWKAFLQLTEHQFKRRNLPHKKLWAKNSRQHRHKEWMLWLRDIFNNFHSNKVDVSLIKGRKVIIIINWGRERFLSKCCTVLPEKRRKRSVCR